MANATRRHVPRRERPVGAPLDPSSRVPRRNLGTLNIIGFGIVPVKDLGPYLAPTVATDPHTDGITYEPGNVVTSLVDGREYICVSSGVTTDPAAAPPDPNWQPFDGRFGLNAHREWSLDPVWHYIGSPGEPSFVSPWVNQGGTKVPMRYTVGIGGKLVIQGSITGGAAASQITTALDPYYYQGDYDITIPAVQDYTGNPAALILMVDGTIWSI